VVTVEVHEDFYDKFINLVGNFNAIKNAGDPAFKAKVMGVD